VHDLARGPLRFADPKVESVHYSRIDRAHGAVLHPHQLVRSLFHAARRQAQNVHLLATIAV